MPVNRRLKLFLLWPLLVIAVLLALLRIALAPSAEYALRDWFAQQGIDATVDDISFDFSESQLQLRGLRAGGEASRLLEVGALDVDWAWRALFDRRIQIDEIRLAGLFVDVEQGPDARLVVAGIDLGGDTGTEREPAAPAPAEPIEWTLDFGNLSIDGFKHCYRAPQDHFSCGGLERLTWNGRIELDLARLDEAVPPLRVSGDFSLDGVELEDNRSEQPLFTLDRLTLEKLRLDGLNEAGFDAFLLSGIYVDIERGEDAGFAIAGIDLGGGAQPVPASNETDGEPLQGNLDLGRIEIDDFRHCYRAPPDLNYCGGFERLNWDGRIGLDLAGLGEAVLPLRAAGNFSLDGVELRHTQLERSLIAFDRFALDALRVDGLDRIEIDSASLDALALLEREDQADRPRVTSLEQLSVDKLLLRDMTRIEITAVDIRGHALTLVKDERGRFEHEQWLPAPATGGTANPVEKAGETMPEKAGGGGEASFGFAVERLDYSTDRALVYRDQSLDKEFVVTLNPVSLKLQNLDSAQPEQASRIEYSAKYAEHGKIDLGGTATPLAARPSFDITGRIEGLDLRDLSPFTAAAIGHRIRSGQLDADLRLAADQGVLDSEVDLVLKQFNLKAISAKEEEKLDASLGFPLNPSLSLLRDKDNRIQLNIPITGDLENPDFDPGDAINQALTRAITAAILNYYTPFGLVTLGQGVFNLATALRFEPVAFPAGADDIATVDTDELDRIATLMQERPGVDVTLCPFTNRGDRIELFPETAEVPVDEFELGDDRRVRLGQLGEARAAAVKRYLAERGIDPSRLVLCAAEHEENPRRSAKAKRDDGDGAATEATADGLAGVEISI